MIDFRWAILWPGPIAHKFADAVTRMGGATLSKIHGRDIHRASAVLGHTGAAQRLAPKVMFPGGVTSQFLCAVDSNGEDAFHIYGERSNIAIHPRYLGATRATLAVAGAAPLTLERPHRINGLEYEIEDAMRCIRTGQMESSVIPLEETPRMIGWMDGCDSEGGGVEPR